MTFTGKADDHERNHDNVLEEYNAFMLHVKMRLTAFSDSINELESNPQHPDIWKNFEFCYLQLRKICECVALATLTCHRHLMQENVQTLESEWHAKNILKALLRDRPGCFPIAVRFEPDADTGCRHLAPIDEALSFKDFSEIYGRIGSRLHVRELRKILKNKLDPFELTELKGWHQSIVSLLNCHMIQLFENGAVLVAFLHIGDERTVECWWAEANGPFMAGGRIYGLPVDDE
ncbi:hypothetical protein [Sandaracinobacteroides saxicola]|uniref:Uncharacterized protein n=1 Tax=Sandaracinobacteroides saxicola TaxID=2759707 RepID=A0A7G5IFR7_9SPHN|nr:hypothetical protein [Sandaracinobacteroides saxicola]QMW22209.1 hypothetical protein H3309_12660 [Sandaracinobacteroides saxicola]